MPKRIPTTTTLRVDIDRDLWRNAKGRGLLFNLNSTADIVEHALRVFLQQAEQESYENRTTVDHVPPHRSGR